MEKEDNKEELLRLTGFTYFVIQQKNKTTRRVAEDYWVRYDRVKTKKSCTGFLGDDRVKPHTIEKEAYKEE